MELVDLTNDHIICHSCTTWGTDADVPDNEEGYLAKEETDVDPPYTVRPDTTLRIRVSSLTSSSLSQIWYHAMHMQAAAAWLPDVTDRLQDTPHLLCSGPCQRSMPKLQCIPASSGWICMLVYHDASLSAICTVAV